MELNNCVHLILLLENRITIQFSRTMSIYEIQQSIHIERSAARPTKFQIRFAFFARASNVVTHVGIGHCQGSFYLPSFFIGTLLREKLEFPFLIKRISLLFSSEYYLMNINSVIERPHSLEVILHALLEFLRDLVDCKKVL